VTHKSRTHEKVLSSYFALVKKCRYTQLIDCIPPFGTSNKNVHGTKDWHTAPQLHREEKLNPAVDTNIPIST
jgi:hypothetical protein